MQADAPQSQKSKKAARAVFGADVDADLEYAAELLHKSVWSIQIGHVSTLYTQDQCIFTQLLLAEQGC